MESLEKPDTTIGNTAEPTPILADGKEVTAEQSNPVQTKKENASIEIASILALLQTDFSDLQSRGLKVSILAREGKLYASIGFDGHVLGVTDTGKKKNRKSITLDEKPVVEYE